MRRKLEVLFAGGITLAAYHLALDAHPEIGNNALLARELGVRVDGPFTNLGVGGRLDPPWSRARSWRGWRELLDREPPAFLEGPATVERVAIISGGAARYAPQAAAEGYDLFLTGEPPSRRCTSPASSASTSSPPATTRPSGSASRRWPRASASGSACRGSSSSCRTRSSSPTARIASTHASGRSTISRWPQSAIRRSCAPSRRAYSNASPTGDLGVRVPRRHDRRAANAGEQRGARRRGRAPATRRRRPCAAGRPRAARRPSARRQRARVARAPAAEHEHGGPKRRRRDHEANGASRRPGWSSAARASTASVRRLDELIPAEPSSTIAVVSSG